jgi:hypothetical protein
MLRFQILLVFLCMVAIAVYGLCLPVVFGTTSADEPPAFCDPDLVSVRLQPGDAITWSIEIESPYGSPPVVHGEGVVQADGRLFVGDQYRPVQVAGLTPTQVETVICKAVTWVAPGPLRHCGVIHEQTYRVRVRLKRDIWIGSPDVLSTR